jgi:hypothetical protein
MALVERLVQQLGGAVALRRHQHALTVQLVIGCAVADEGRLAQDLPQLAGRKAGADDRAMELLGQLPDLRPPRRCGSRGLRRLLINTGRVGSWNDSPGARGWGLRPSITGSKRRIIVIASIPRVISDGI